MNVVWSNNEKGKRPLADDEGSYLPSEEIVTSGAETVDEVADSGQTVRELGKAATPLARRTYQTGYAQKHSTRLDDAAPDTNFSA